MTMTKNFNDLNETFNTSDDIVQPEVIERKIEKEKDASTEGKKKQTKGGRATKTSSKPS